MSPAGYLSGTGYFLALSYSAWDETADSVKLGLQPSIESGLVEGIDDVDRVIIMKITNKDEQKFVTLTSKGTHSTKKLYDLSGLTLLDAGA